MGPPGSDGDTYLKMIKHDAVNIAEQLIWGLTSEKAPSGDAKAPIY
jgi:hypothetical protein